MAKKNIATFLSGGKGLVIAGNHAYAYSGFITTASGTTKTYLDFTTGKEYIIAKLTFAGPLLITNSGAGDNMVYQVSFNGINIHIAKNATKNENSPFEAHVELLIPPLTEVIVEGQSDGSNFNTSVVLAGRIYDA